MTGDQARELFNRLVGREVIVICKNDRGGGMNGFNAVGRLTKTEITDLWEVNGLGLDPTQPPQSGAARQLSVKVSVEDVGFVIELGDLSAISPAAISRPQGTGGGKIVTPFR
jgi:hypothetical protein